MPCDKTSNPASVPVPQNESITLAARSHASHFQKVTVSFSENMSSPVAVFTGTGEDAAMKADGKTSVRVPTGGNSSIFLKFEYSSHGEGGPFQDAKYVCKPVASGVLWTITSEDATDTDDNDTYFYLIDPS